MPNEFEYKLQYKFSDIEKPVAFQHKFKGLLALLGIPFNGTRRIKLVDDYYDDDEGTLKGHNLSLRARTGESPEGTVVLTLKGAKENPFADGLNRKQHEFTCPDPECTKLLTDPSRLLREAGVPDGLRLGKLERVLRVHNDRLSIDFTTQLAKWQLSYDRFYFKEPRTDVFSHYFSEVEIELQSEALPKDGDPQVEQIKKALKVLFGFSDSDTPKLARGLERARQTANVRMAYTVGFDIVGYSKREADVQLQIIQKLNKFVKEAILEVRKSDREVIYIPTGDGMYIVFEDSPEHILPIVVAVQSTTKEYVAALKKDDRFTFRTGIHAGPVFKYSDVNEKLNYAGNGINMAARVLNLGDEWHILATHEAKEVLGSQRIHNRNFHDLGNHEVKHGVPIHVYNYVDLDRDVGSQAPIK